MKVSFIRKLFVFGGFIILAMLISGFATGTIVNLKAKKLEKLSGISIDYEPKDARLFLNDKEVSIRKSPYSSVGLRNGTYKVKLIKEGYSSFEEEVELEPGKVTRLSVLLFLTSPEKLALSEREKKIFEDVLPDRESFGEIKFLNNELYIDDQFVSRFSKDIKEASWLSEDYLILQVGEEIRAVSRDARYQVLLFKLPSEERAKLYLSSSKKELFVGFGKEYFKLKIR